MFPSACSCPFPSVLCPQRGHSYLRYFLPEMFLVALVALYTGITTYDTWMTIRAQRRRRAAKLALAVYGDHHHHHGHGHGPGDSRLPSASGPSLMHNLTRRHTSAVAPSEPGSPSGPSMTAAGAHKGVASPSPPRSRFHRGPIAEALQPMSDAMGVWGVPASAVRSGGSIAGKSRPAGAGAGSDDDDDNDEADRKAAGMTIGRAAPGGDKWRPRRYKPTIGPFWMTYELLVCALMCAALAVLFTYALKLTRGVPREDAFDVYDADAFTPARYALLKRREVAADGVLPGGVNVSSVGRPGQALRWALPSDASSLDDVGNMYGTMDSMYNATVSQYNQRTLCIALCTIYRIQYTPHRRVLLPVHSPFVFDLTVVCARCNMYCYYYGTLEPACQ